MKDPWASFMAISALDLRDPILEVHHALQVVAAAGQAFAEPRPDDSHRATTWNAGLGAFVGVPWKEGYPFRVALDPRTLKLALLERSSEVLGSFMMEGRTLADAYTWLGDAVRTYLGGDPMSVQPPDFEIPEHPVGRGEPFRPDEAGRRGAVAALFGSAAETLEHFVTGRENAEPVRCWPHHFDVGTVLTITPAVGDAPARTVGVGMAPMGGGYDTWYWYVNAWPAPDADDLPEHDGPGHWHREGWTGLVLEPDEIEEARAGASRASVVKAFLDGAVATAT